MASQTAARAATVRRRWVGIPRLFLHSIFGEPESESARRLRKASTAHQGLYQSGRVFATLLIFAFSFAAVWTMAHKAIVNVLGAIMTGHAPDPTDTSEVVIIALMGIGADIAVLICANQIRDSRGAGEPLSATRIQQILLMMICGIESGTYLDMVVVNERPHDPLAWSLVIGRAIVVPAVACFLSMAERKALGRAAFHGVVSRDVSTMFIEGLHTALAEGRADLMMLLSLLHFVQPGTDEEKRHDLALLQQVRQMIPNADETAQAGLIQRGMLAWITTGEWPAELVAMVPELAGVTPETLATRAGGANTKRRAVATVREPQSRAEAERVLLANLGLSAATAPMTSSGSRARGVWVTSSDIATLSGGRIAGDACREFMGKVSGSQRNGRSYVAPFRRVMAELYDRRLLGDTTQDAWENYRAKWGDIDADTGEDESAQLPLAAGAEGQHAGRNGPTNLRALR